MGTLGCDAFGPVLRDWHDAGIDLLVWDGLPGHRGVLSTRTPVPTIIRGFPGTESRRARRRGDSRGSRRAGLCDALSEDAGGRVSILRVSGDRQRVKQLTGYPWIIGTLKELPWRGSDLTRMV